MNTPIPATATKIRAFLMSKPSECVSNASLEAERGFILRGRDTSGVFGARFSAQWMGKDAVEFLKANLQDLIPGRCVDLELFAVKPHGSELTAVIHACQLAPLAPSWIAHEANKNQPVTSNTPTN